MNKTKVLSRIFWGLVICVLAYEQFPLIIEILSKAVDYTYNNNVGAVVMILGM
jgi:hypothetical protein